MQAAAKRFGKRVIEVMLVFPKVRTALMDRSSVNVAVREARVKALIQPNSGSGFPYPLGSPAVRIEFPGLEPGGDVPWLGGLAWIDGSGGNGAGGAMSWPLPPLPGGQGPFGIPCLWRQGGWSPGCDLIFVARQVHRLLTDPGDYSPKDAMNPEAALYWAAHRDALPFEPSIPELYGRCRRTPVGRFRLVAVE
jgi:hypothetical protein